MTWPVRAHGFGGEKAQRHKGGRDDADTAGGKAVHAVGEIDGVGGGGHIKNGDDDKEPVGKGDAVFIEGHPEHLAVGDIGEIAVEKRSDENAAAELEEQFFPRFEAVAAGIAKLAGEFEPVIPCAQRPEPQQHKQRLDDKSVVDFCPKQCSYCYGEQYYQTSHRGGVGLALLSSLRLAVVEFGPVADFFFHQPADDFWADENRDYKTCQRSADRAEHNILICVKAQLLGVEKSQQFVNQFLSLS